MITQEITWYDPDIELPELYHLVLVYGILERADLHGKHVGYWNGRRWTSTIEEDYRYIDASLWTHKPRPY